jgi:hypothetical protein
MGHSPGSPPLQLLVCKRQQPQSDIARSDGILFARFRANVLPLKRQAWNGLGSKQPRRRRNQQFGL